MSSSDSPAGTPLLRVEGLSKFFPVQSGLFGKTVGHVRAVDNVSLSIYPGETLGIVGESGCGKTTTGRSILRLIEPTSGRVELDGVDLTTLDRRQMRRARRRLQIVFQDPYGSLNPRKRIVDIVGEALEQHGLVGPSGLNAHVRELLEQVGLNGDCLYRYPHEFSGGQRQRIGIARALAVSPDLIVCDEAVSALDVSVQAQVLNLLIGLRKKFNLSYLFIAHDLSVVRHISDRVAVMYLGRIVEMAPCEELFRRPAHPYTRALLSAIPRPEPGAKRQRVILRGDVPTPLNPPPGCHFHTRCHHVVERCREHAPTAFELPGGRQARCFHAEGLTERKDWFDVLEQRLARHQQANPTPNPVQPKRLDRIPGSSSAAPSPGGWAAVPRRRAAGSQNLLRNNRQIRAVARLGSIALLLTGMGCVAAGTTLTGLGLFSLGVVSARWVASQRKSPQTAQRWRGWVGWATVALSLSFALARLSRPWRERQTARQQLLTLAELVKSYTDNTGSLPPTLEALRWRTAGPFGRGAPTDPWGRQYRYSLPRSNAPPRVFSLAKDGKESSDDIVVHIHRPRAHRAFSPNNL